MGITFGKNARETGRYRSLVWSLQYVNEEPSIVIAKAGRMTAGFMHCSGAAVIGLSSAHKYRGDRKADIREAMPRWINIVRVIGLDPLSRNDIKLVADCIEFLMEGVVKMKPMPELMKSKAPDVEVSIDGNRMEVVLH